MKEELLLKPIILKLNPYHIQGALEWVHFNCRHSAILCGSVSVWKKVLLYNFIKSRSVGRGITQGFMGVHITAEISTAIVRQSTGLRMHRWVHLTGL